VSKASKKHTKLKIGDFLEEKCPVCHKKSMKVVGIYHRLDKSHEVECQNDFYTERVNPEHIEFSYEPPKENKKDKKKEAS
jgi:hypothetical protein